MLGSDRGSIPGTNVMAKRREEHEAARSDAPAPSLRHNPFAALRKDGGGPTSSLENAAPMPVVGHEARSRAGAGAPSASKSSGSPAKPAVHASLAVRREKKGRGGKAVTIAEGAGLAGRDLDALARELAKSLGAGARVEDGAIVVQGEQVDRLVAQLEQRGFKGIVRGN
jgi:translation initiation factor 1